MTEPGAAERYGGQPPSRPPSTRLLLLRHGESEWNAQGRWQGWADPPLTAQGRCQAQAAGRQLGDQGFTATAASDLQRARQTAGLAGDALGLPPEVYIDPALREYDVGAWSGLTRPEIEAGWPGALEDWREGRLVATPGGETRHAFETRISGALMRIGAVFPGATVLVITHGGVIAALERSLGASPRRLAHLTGRWFSASTDGVRMGDDVAAGSVDAHPDQEEAESVG
jgi:probable phosphoglycerate mutase